MYNKKICKKNFNEMNNNRKESNKRKSIKFINKIKIFLNNNAFIKNNSEKKVNIYNKKYLKKNFVYIYSTFILLLFFPLFFSKNLSLLDLSSEITLTIKGTGDQYILNSITTYNYNYNDELPDAIYVNGEYVSTKTNKILGLTKNENNVTLQWNTNLKNCANMFRQLTNIIKANLSKFDSSEVTNMYCMFISCTNLISIDLSNLKTSSVINMRSMFHSCSSLISLDLTSFDTSSVAYTYHMFMDCSSLVFINLYSFTEKKLNWTNGMFLNTQKNLIYCFNEQNIQLIKNELKSLNTNNDCLNTCFKKDIIVDTNNIKCKLDCSKNIYYSYNDECFESCPIGTYIADINNNLCVDYCNSYYNYEKTACIKEIPKGFYLNNSELKTIDKCHKDCETCNKKATDNNSNCLTCPDSKFFKFGNCVSCCDKGYINRFIK